MIHEVPLTELREWLSQQTARGAMIDSKRMPDAQALRALHARLATGGAHGDWPVPAPMPESLMAVEPEPLPMERVA